MAGKSTYMRQVALICLMAQIGSFVPAKRAQLSVVDSIFTRVGASDDLATGQSTFMVEMNEVSTIIKNAGKKKTEPEAETEELSETEEPVLEATDEDLTEEELLAEEAFEENPSEEAEEATEEETSEE
jgi:hypothetical protein